MSSSQDAELTMTTMVEDPTVIHVPVLTGGRSWRELHEFYRDRFFRRGPATLNLCRSHGPSIASVSTPARPHGRSQHLCGRGDSNSTPCGTGT